MKVDCHNHVLPSAALELLASEPVYRARVDGRRITGDGHSDFRNGVELTAEFHDPAAKLADLSARGIDGAMVSVAPALFYYETDASAGLQMCEAVNEGLARFCAHDSARLGWYAHVPMQDPEAAAQVLERAVAAGAVGVEIGTSVDGLRLDDRVNDPFWAAASRLGTVVQIHPAYNNAHPGLTEWYLQNAIGNPLETTIAIERLVCAGTLDRFPNVRILLVHGGGFVPYQLGRLAHAATVRRELADVGDPWVYLHQLWFDTIAHDAAALAYLISRVPEGHVVLGSDLPFDMAPADAVSQLVAAVEPDVASAVLERNHDLLFAARYV